MARPRKPRPIEIPIGPSIAYVPLTQGQFALIDREDAERVGNWTWFAHRRHGQHYATTNVPSGDGKQKTLSLHTLVAPEYRDQIDHRNREPLDCRKANLRPANYEQNAWNHRPTSRRSPYKGIRPNGNRWVAIIASKGKPVYLGTHATAEDAARAYDRAAIQLRGEFAVTNFSEVA